MLVWQKSDMTIEPGKRGRESTVSLKEMLEKKCSWVTCALKKAVLLAT